MKITEERNIIEAYGKKTIQKFTDRKWEGDNNITFFEDKKEIGKISLDDTTLDIQGKPIIEFIKTLIKEKEDAEKLKITDQTAKKSIFKTMFTNLSKYNGLNNNHVLFYKFEKQFKKAGIEEVKVGGTIDMNNIIKDKMTLLIDISPQNATGKEFPSGFYTRLKGLLYSKYQNNASDPEHFNCCPQQRFLRPILTEKPEEIKMQNMIIGRYFKGRNNIQLYFNPFMFKKLLPLEYSYSDVFDALFKTLIDMKLKPADTKKLRRDIFTENFMKNARDRIISIQSNLQSNISQVGEYEKQIGSTLITLQGYQDEILYLEKNIATKGKGMYEEIKKVNSLPFVKKLEIKTSTIDITFNETTINISDFIREPGKRFGKRTMYLGEIKIQVNPSGFNIYNNNLKYPESGNPHPHASGNGGTPCLGGGAGKAKIYEMLSSNKFVELTKLLWFWIKTYNDRGAYTKAYSWYDKRLSEGLPIWDEKGNRIEMNEKDRLISGEQKQLDPNDSYNDNIKKYKNKKIF